MPSIKEDSTVQLIAETFCGEGKRNKTQTMIAIGYDEGYSDSGKGHKTVFGNIRVIAAIAKIDAKGAKRLEVTVDSLALKYEETYQFAKACNQPAAMNGAITGTARLFALDHDSQNDTQERELTEAEQVEANRYAMWKLSQSKTA